MADTKLDAILCQFFRLVCSEGCVIYSVGSNNKVGFEAELLNRTACDVHVFDPTVPQSALRAREVQLNTGLSRRRIWWHSVGLSHEDIEHGSCAPQLFCTCFSSRVESYSVAFTHFAVDGLRNARRSTSCV
jgi:Methyltransferase domain